MKSVWIVFLILVVLRIFILAIIFNSRPVGDELEYLSAIESILNNNFSPYIIYSDSAQPAFNFYPAIIISIISRLPYLISLRLVAFAFGIGSLFLMTHILKKRFSLLVTSLSLAIFGLNPALLQFSNIGWFNIQTVFFTLLAFIALEKSIYHLKKYRTLWFFVFIILQIWIFEGYLFGRVFGLMLFLLYYIELRDVKKRIIFISLSLVLLAPYVYSISLSKGLAIHRAMTTVITLSDMSTLGAISGQLIPTVGGFLGFPYSTSFGPDNKYYASVFQGILPFYFSPFMIIGLVTYARSAIKNLFKNNFTFSLSAFWLLTCIVVLGVNILTVYPLNISRSLLLVPIHTLLIAYGLSYVLKFKFLKIPVVFVALFLCALNIIIYVQWFKNDFRQNVSKLNYTSAQAQLIGNN